MTDSGAERAARRIVQELSDSLKRIAPLLGLEPQIGTALTSEALIVQWAAIIREETGTHAAPDEGGTRERS